MENTITRREALALLPLTHALSAVPERKTRAFRHSDVVFGFPFTPEEYKMWHGTVLYGWTRGPKTADDVPGFIERKEQALKVGVKSGVALNAFAIPADWFRERDPEWRDHVWRNPKGELLSEPWVRPPDPFPPEQARICSNHPRYLELKFQQADLALRMKPFAFHIDDPLASATVLSRSGCLCRLCVNGFREYVKKHVTKDRLDRLGIDNIEGFDYSLFLRYRKDKPLWYEFENFQLRRTVENVKQIVSYARRHGGESMLIGANAPLMGGHIVYSPYLDYICAEVGTDAKAMKFCAKPLFNYKMGEALGIAVAATGIYQDWVMLTQHDIPDLVRGWVAESYALGANFIVPHKEWGFVQPPGQLPQRTAYPARVELIGPLYKFVREYPNLFDGYEAVTEVGLLFDYRSTRVAGRGLDIPRAPTTRPLPYHDICLELANANIQFGMAVAGSEPFDHELTREHLERYPLLIVNDPLALEGSRRRLIDEWEKKGRIIHWSGAQSVLSRIQRLTESDPDVWVLPRTRKNSPLVCHVLNRHLDAASERMVPKRNLAMRLNRKLFVGREFRKCSMYVEKQSPVTLPVRASGAMIEVTVPELELWAVLTFG
jgi:hypothetical protein